MQTNVDVNSFRRASASSRRQPEPGKWAKIWFKQLCRFHRCSTNRGWQFSLDQVIQFLRSRVEKKEPAWKRLKIVEALAEYQSLNRHE